MFSVIGVLAVRGIWRRRRYLYEDLLKRPQSEWLLQSEPLWMSKVLVGSTPADHFSSASSFRFRITPKFCDTHPDPVRIEVRSSRKSLSQNKIVLRKVLRHRPAHPALPSGTDPC